MTGRRSRPSSPTRSKTSLTGKSMEAEKMVVAAPNPHPLLHRARAHGPKTRLGELIWRAYRYLPEQLGEELLDALASVVLIESSLRLESIRSRRWTDHGIVSRKVITDAGVAQVVNAFRNT